jgi:hypothetical protein
MLSWPKQLLMKTLFFSLLCFLPLLVFAQRPTLSSQALKPGTTQASLGPTGCVLAVVDQKCGGNNQYSGHYIAGTFSSGSCTNNSNIKKVRVRYRNLTDNKSMQTRTYDFNGNWYVQNLDPDKRYEIHVEVKFSVLGVFRAAGRVTEWSSCNQTQMTLNNVASGEITVCGANQIILDGSGSTDETGYVIAIRELNSSNQLIGPEFIRHFNGNAPSRFDVRAYAASQGFPLQFGKRYAVKLVTKPIWREKTVWINLKTMRQCALQPVNDSARQARRPF